MNTNASGSGQGAADAATETDDLLEVLKLIAERAGKVILAYYAEGDAVEVSKKADQSPVTAADEAAEEFILEALAKLTPDIPVIAEEAVAAGKIPEVGDGPFWLVDPLDGTKEFLTRNGEFTVNIALIKNQRPVAGVVHAPAMAMTWAGASEPGQPARAVFANTDQPTMDIRCREIPAEGAVVVASRRHGSGADLDAFLADYKVGEMISAGSSLKFCLVATGRADLYPRFGRTMEWDTAAGHAVLLAAGGQVKTLDGSPLTYRKPGFENPHFYAVGLG